MGLEGSALFLMQMGWICCFFPQKILKFPALGYWEWGDIKSDFGFIMAAAEVSFFVAQAESDVHIKVLTGLGSHKNFLTWGLCSVPAPTCCPWRAGLQRWIGPQGQRVLRSLFWLPDGHIP